MGLSSDMGISFISYLLLSFVILFLPSTVFASQTTTISINSSSDDGADVAGSNTFHSAGNPGNSWLGTSNLAIGGRNSSGNIITTGLRFNNISVPQGATIESATFDLQNAWGGNYAGFVKLLVKGAKVANLTTFSNSNLPRSFSLTTASAPWNSTSESIIAGKWYSATIGNKPPTIASVIQEIVNQPDWVSGNSLGLIFVDNGSTNDWWYEISTYESGVNNAAKLTITYISDITPTATLTPTLELSPTPTLAEPTPTPTVCVLTSAFWSTVNAIEGDTVSLNAVGSDNCGGKSVTFEVWQNGIGGGLMSPAPVPTTVTFNPGSNLVNSSWVAQYTPVFPLTDAQYYFKAILAGGNTIDTGGSLLTVTSSTVVTPTPTPTPTPIVEATNSSYFSLDQSTSTVNGFVDNVPRQFIRANNDKVYIYGAVATTGTVNMYWNPAGGYPNSSADFSGHTSFNNGTGSLNVFVVDGAYDGANTIHVLIMDMAGNLKDYPFDITTNTFKTPLTISTDNSHPLNNTDIGTTGVSSMFDTLGTLHVAYWAANSQIMYSSFTYNSVTNTLTQVSIPTRLDNSSGNANHPELVVSPVDQSVTVAWVIGTNGAGSISTRTRQSGEAWGAIEAASTGAVWTSPNAGVNIDQGPSMVVDSTGMKAFIYIENFGSCGTDYGRAHFVSKAAGATSWTDQSISNFCTHAPGLAIDSSNHYYILGHGHPANPSCTLMEQVCSVQRNSNGSWDNPVVFATPPSGSNFDNSVSPKWSVVGWNRPETIEFAMFDAINNSYQNTGLWYGRLATTGSGTGPTPTQSGPTPTPTETPIPPTPTPTLFPTSTPTPTPGSGLVAAYNFNEGTGKTVKDLSGFGNNGTISSPSWSKIGKYGKTLNFGSLNRRVVVKDSNSLDLITGMTLEAWVYPTSGLSNNVRRTVLLKEQTGDLAYSLYANGVANNPYSYIFSNGLEVNTGAGGVLPLNTWTHLSATFDGIVLKLYKNGILISSNNYVGSIFTSSGALNIGANAVWTGEIFNGRIDEVRVYNRALSPVEIQADMNTPL